MEHKVKDLMENVKILKPPVQNGEGGEASRPL
jgi:hypothetical protein